MIPGASLAPRAEQRLNGWTSVTSIADVVAQESVLGRLGATFIPLSEGDTSVVALAEGEARHVPSEGAALTEWSGDMVAGAGDLGFFDVGALVKVTRRLLRQAPSTEYLLRAALRRAAAREIERGVLQGSGSSGEPAGLIDPRAGAGQTSWAGSVPSWAEAAGAVEGVADGSDCDPGRLGWLCSTSDFSAWLQAPGRSASEPLLAQGTEPGQWSCAGAPVVFTKRLPSGCSILGDWSQLYIGTWGNPQLLTNPYMSEDFSVTKISFFQVYGVTAAHAERFLVGSAS